MRVVEMEVQRGLDILEPFRNIFERYFSSGNMYIAGGFARWMASAGPKPAGTTDIDFFFYGSTSFHTCYNKFLSIDGVKELTNSPQAVTLQMPDTPVWKRARPYKIQLIRALDNFYGSSLSVLDNFDFTVTQATYPWTETTVAVCENFELDETKRILRFQEGASVYDPVKTALRAQRYIRKGYYMGEEEWVKLMQPMSGNRRLLDHAAERARTNRDRTINY